MRKADLDTVARKIIRLTVERRVNEKRGLIKIKNEVCREFGINTFPDAKLLEVFHRLEANGEAPDSRALRDLLRKRGIRTLSGIAPVSVLMPPAPCKSACVYCPSERADNAGKTLFQHDSEKKYGKQNVPSKYQKPGVLVMPKSYLSSEPGAMRALLAGFNPKIQIARRIKALKNTGHSADKCELIVQGGTFSDLKKRERTRFITRCYQAFNQEDGDDQHEIGDSQHKTGDSINRKTAGGTLGEAQKRNESAAHRVVGLTLETRPGSVTPDEIREFRRLGCTRVEIGVQTLDDEITRKTRRIQTREEVKTATALLRQAGFKICYHIMPGLPFSTPEKDFETYREVCENPDFCPDLVKMYPCSVVPFSELQRWYEKGDYIPYSDETLFALLRKMKQITPPWIRISRLIRDIPGTAILGGNKVTNLRQLIQAEMKKTGERCRCIRCREIRSRQYDPAEVRFTVRKYEAAGGIEYFLSYELDDETLLAMLRLRIPGQNEQPVFRSLRNSAIIRELHTFGSVAPIGDLSDNKTQHTGFGKQLICEAENICRQNDVSKLSVISGVGVKEYYRKLGFFDDGTYLSKQI